MLSLTRNEQQLLDLLLEMPPNFDDAKDIIQEMALQPEGITKVGINYAEECFLDAGNVVLCNVPLTGGAIPGLHSTYICDVVKFLLNYGLGPNAVFESPHCQYNIMSSILYIDNEYLAADALTLLLEAGGDPNLVVDGESIFEQVDFEIWFASAEQEIRWRYDSWVHVWMVLLAYGGEIPGKGSLIETFREYENYATDERFDLKKLRNHREYYFGLTRENNECVIHIFDKRTFWEVAKA